MILLDDGDNGGVFKGLNNLRHMGVLGMSGSKSQKPSITKSESSIDIECSGDGNEEGWHEMFTDEVQRDVEEWMDVQGRQIVVSWTEEYGRKYIHEWMDNNKQDILEFIGNGTQSTTKASNAPFKVPRRQESVRNLMENSAFNRSKNSMDSESSESDKRPDFKAPIKKQRLGISTNKLTL